MRSAKLALTKKQMNKKARRSNYGSARLLFVVLAATLTACSTSADRGDTRATNVGQSGTCSPTEMVALNEGGQTDMKSYVIKPGDELHIAFYLSPEFDRDATVRTDGNVVLPLVGDMRAAGLTPKELAAEVDQAYLKELRNPEATVRVLKSPSRRIYVQGQVTHAGVFDLEPGMTALQAIAEAGGVTETAAADSAVLIRRDACGEPQGMVVNLTAADSGKKIDDVALMPSDVLVVPRSKIGNVDLFVKQYIAGLLPFPPYFAMPL